VTIDACVTTSGGLFRANGLEGRYRRNVAGDAAAAANDVAASAGFQQSIVPRHSRQRANHDAHDEGNVGSAPRSDEGVAGSNPATPTIFLTLSMLAGPVMAHETLCLMC
jgi:hypothetical protein